MPPKVGILLILLICFRYQILGGITGLVPGYRTTVVKYALEIWSPNLPTSRRRLQRDLLIRVPGLPLYFHPDPEMKEINLTY